MKCEYCGATENLTTDHIIPKWIYKRAQFLTPKPQTGFKKNLGTKNHQTLCQDCNFRKSGFIDCRHPIARQFWTLVRDIINAELEPDAGDTKPRLTNT